MFSCVLGPDIELRLATPRRAEQLFALVDKNREYLRQWLPWVDDIQSPDDSRESRRRALERFAFNGSFDAEIWYQGEMAGIIGLHQIDWNNRKTAIGYWLGEEFQGKGLMTLACKALVDYAFDTLDLNRIEIRAATQNLRSRAVPERLGFRHEGTLLQNEFLYDHYVDSEVYAMLKEEWEARKVEGKW